MPIPETRLEYVKSSSIQSLNPHDTASSYHSVAGAALVGCWVRSVKGWEDGSWPMCLMCPFMFSRFSEGWRHLFVKWPLEDPAIEMTSSWLRYDSWMVMVSSPSCTTAAAPSDKIVPPFSELSALHWVIELFLDCQHMRKILHQHLLPTFCECR